jgi:Domain of unknown function (DUF4349)
VARLATPPAGYFADNRGGGGGGLRSFNYASASLEQTDDFATRKIIRNGSLELLVSDVSQATDKIGSVVARAGGFIEKSTQTNSAGHSASITVRVPAGQLDHVMVEVKALATAVEREGVEARDVTRDYIDLDSRLRNAQAEEAQYLQILKKAATIKDTLDVTEKLSDVRGRIEQLQREMKFLTSQIDMSSLQISLRAESESTVAGIHWRPLHQAKIALGEMISGLIDWVDAVIAFFINLPLILLWCFSGLVLLVVSLRLIRFLWPRLGPKSGWRFPWRLSQAERAADTHT